MRSAFRNVSQMTTQTAHPSQRPGDLEDQSPGAQDRPRHWPGQRFARRTRRDPSKNIALVSSQPLPPEQSRNVSGLLRGQLSTTVGGGSGSGSWRGAAALSMLDRFFLLPPELQLQILSYLDFGDVERFRRTCRLLRSRISKPLLRSLFPNLPAALLATCYLCLRSDDSRQGLVRGELSDARYPLASRCFGCIAQRDGFMVGRRYQLGNDATAWVCRWCGYPVAADGAWNQPEFHKLCYRRYGLILMIYVGAGCAQWCVVVVGAALCWAFFQHNLLVVPPTIVNFFMATWALILSIMRGPTLRTYHWALLLECGIVGLWVPPIIAASDIIQETPQKPPPISTMVTVVFIGMNVVCRLLNILGYVVLMFEYKFWRRNKPQVPLAKRAMHQAIAGILFWTYPQSVEQEYPPKWWFSRRAEPSRAELV